MAEHCDVIAFAERQVTPWNFLVGRADDACAAGCFQLFDTAYMVEMVVGHQNVAQLPTRVGREPSLDRRRIARVNHRAATLRWVLEQPYVVVREGRQCVDFYHERVAKQGTKVHLRWQWRCWLRSTIGCASALLSRA